MSDMKWISVEDNLPDDYNYKLMFYRHIIILGYFAPDDDKVWRDDTGIVRPHVTHWMPLPEPPKD